MSIFCKHCNLPIPSANTQAQSSTILCDACGTLFSLGSGQPRASTGQKSGKEVNDGTWKDASLWVRLEKRGDATAIVYKLRTPQAGLKLFMTLTFSVLFASITVVSAFYPQLLGDSFTSATSFNLFAGFGTLICLFMTYNALAQRIATLTVLVKQGWLTVSTAPLPVKLPQKFPIGSISQIYCRQLTAFDDEGRSSIHYEVRLLQKDGRDVRLIDNIATPDEALALETKIEGVLDLRDVPIPGEIGNRTGSPAPSPAQNSRYMTRTYNHRNRLGFYFGIPIILAGVGSLLTHYFLAPTSPYPLFNGGIILAFIGWSIVATARQKCPSCGGKIEKNAHLFSRMSGECDSCGIQLR